MAENPPSAAPTDRLSVYYDTAGKDWRTHRTFNSFGSLKSFGTLEKYVPSQRPHNYGNQAKRSEIREDVDKLSRARPEIQPGVQQALQSLDESSRATKLSEHLTGELVSVVPAHLLHAPAESNHYEPGQRLVLAMPSGSHPDKVSLVELVSCTRDWKQESGVLLNIFHLQNTLRTTWAGDGSCIRQISFTPKSTSLLRLLVVRTATAVYILQVTLSASELSVNHLITMPAFTFECANIALKARASRYVAAVGSNGEFSVWNIVNSSKTKSFTRCKLCGTGCMLSPAFEPPDGNHERDGDGWRRVQWASQQNALLLCSRKHLECWNIPDPWPPDIKQLQRLGSYSTTSFALNSPIVDLQVCESKHTDIFLLTTKEVAVLRLHRDADSVTFEKMLSWSHGRDSGDLFLRFSVVNDLKDIHLILFSHQNDLLTSFSLNFPLPKIPVVYRRDQTRLPWRDAGLLSVMNWPLSTQLRNSDKPEYPWLKHVSTWQMFFLLPDLSLHGCLCYAQSERLKNIKDLDVLSSFITAGRDVIVSSTTDQLAAAEEEGGEEENSEEEFESGVDQPNPTGMRSRGNLRGRGLPMIGQMEVAYSVPRERVIGAIGCSSKEDLKPGKETLNSLSSKITGQRKEKAKELHALSTFVSESIAVEEIHAAVPLAIQLRERLSEYIQEDAGQWLISPLATPETLGLSMIGLAGPNFSMNQMYSRLLGIYNRPLHSAVRGHQRLLKEALARRAASSLSLASVGVRFAPATEISSIDSTSIPAMDTQSSQRNLMHSQKHASQQQPSSMGVEISSSADTTLSGASDLVAQSIARLGRYTDISAASAVSMSMFEGSMSGLARVIGHWDLNVDPAQYSYEATNAILTGESTILGSAMSAADREKVARREMRARQRQAARQARFEAMRPKEPDFRTNDAGVKRQKIHDGRSQNEHVSLESQAEYPMQPHGSSMELEQTSRHVGETSSSEARAVEAVTDSSRVQSGGKQLGHARAQGLMPAQQWASRPRLPDRGRRPPKKPGF